MTDNPFTEGYGPSEKTRRNVVEYANKTSITEAAKKFGWSVNTVSRWVAEYDKAGLVAKSKQRK